MDSKVDEAIATRVTLEISEAKSSFLVPLLGKCMVEISPFWTYYLSEFCLKLLKFVDFVHFYQFKNQKNNK